MNRFDRSGRAIELRARPTRVAVLPNTVDEARFAVAVRPEWASDDTIYCMGAGD